MGTRARACLGLAVLVTCVCTNAVTMAQELVRFDSAPVRLGELQQRLARERGEAPKAADTIEGYLAKPEGDGPFAAIVYLHGCDGLSKDAPMFIAQFVTGLGYVSLAVDSFATRGIKDACTKPMPALMLARQGDALGALSYLSKLPSVDPQRIAVLGGSMGAMVALQLASTHHVETFDAPRDLKFKAAVAYYPLCGVASEELIVPALILIGELDDWTPARDCELWMKRRADRGARPGFRRRQGNARALAQVRCESGQECNPGDGEFPLCSILPLSNSEANAHTRLEQRPVIGSDSEVG